MAKRKTSNGQKKPVRADGAKGAAAQRPGDPVEQDPRAEAPELAGASGGGDAAGPADVEPRGGPADDAVDAVDAFAYAAMGVDSGNASTQLSQSTLNVMAASAAAGMAHGAGHPFETMFCDIGFSGTRAGTQRRMAEAAAFIRAWPLAPIDALPMHLKLKGFEVPSVGRRELLAWRVFGFVLAQLDQADRDEAAEAARQASEAEAAKPRGVLRGRLAMKPIDRNPLSQMGKVLQRQKKR